MSNFCKNWDINHNKLVPHVEMVLNQHRHFSTYLDTEWFYEKMSRPLFLCPRKFSTKVASWHCSLKPRIPKKPPNFQAQKPQTTEKGQSPWIAFHYFCMKTNKTNLCCDLCRSPSWPVWAPRLPTLSQNQCYTGNESGNDSTYLTPPTFPISQDGNRFWSPGTPRTPVSSRNRNTYHENTSKTPKTSQTFQTLNSPKASKPSKLSKALKTSIDESKNGGLNNNVAKTDSSIGFKVPVQDALRYSRRHLDHCPNDNQTREKSKVKPRIGQQSWRNISKTCDCLEKGKTSPVLRLANQTRAVSSPDPLHRPDTPRSSLQFTTAGQSLR